VWPIALAQAQQVEQAQMVWAETERVSRSIEDSKVRDEALSQLGKVLAIGPNCVQLLHHIQRSWQQAVTKEYWIELLSLAHNLIHLNPEICIVLYEAFSWVDDILKG
jgi:hypothetical protein